MASAADLAGSGAGAGAGGPGMSTEIAEMASPGVRPSVETVCGISWLWKFGGCDGRPLTTD